MPQEGGVLAIFNEGSGAGKKAAAISFWKARSEKADVIGEVGDGGTPIRGVL